MNRNGTHAVDVDEHEDDLLGVVEIALTEAREELAYLVERCEILAELRRRGLELAAVEPSARTPITGERLREHALAQGGEEERARVESLFARFDRLTT